MTQVLLNSLPDVSAKPAPEPTEHKHGFRLAPLQYRTQAGAAFDVSRAKIGHTLFVVHRGKPVPVIVTSLNPLCTQTVPSGIKPLKLGA
jgi:hypothetical protein